jgi:hypothetical protein
MAREKRKKSISGLVDGCGFFNETCGVLTGAVCLLSWYAGKGADEEPESEKLLPMLQDLGEQTKLASLELVSKPLFEPILVILLRSP